MLSIANPGLVASSAATPMSASKVAAGGVGGVQSFRGRGGAFGMLLHKVQAAQPLVVSVPGATAGPGGVVGGGEKMGGVGGLGSPDGGGAGGDVNGAAPDGSP